MDDHTDQAVFGSLRVGAVILGTRSIEADHRIFHSTNGSVHTDGHRIRIWNREVGIHLKSMCDGLSRIPAPEGLSFDRKIAHGQGHALGSGNGHSPGIPGKGGTRSPREISDVFRVEHPCAVSIGDTFLVGKCLFGRDDENGLLRGHGLGQPRSLTFTQNLIGIGEHSGGCDDMGLGNGDRDRIVSEFGGELTGT